ncbi:MAG: hypothetical protein AAF566_06075 [Pseudomonadota bacterium]
MDDLKFNCPEYLAQRFWKHCVDQSDTPGAVLRAFMVNEVQQIDPSYEVDMTAIKASKRWVVRAVPEDES